MATEALVSRNDVLKFQFTPGQSVFVDLAGSTRFSDA
jgi:hypothetical protein